MPLITKILHPTDFSPCAEHALEYAATLAARFSAPLVLLHVYTPPTTIVPEGYVPLPVDEVALRDAHSRGLDEQVARARSHFAGIIEPVLVVGSAWREIVREAKQRGCDLIVLGTHGRGGIARVLLGSVAERVVRKAECPVLTVGSTSPHPDDETPNE
jgi:nucleotide-binding universal stress UspA family protein